MAFTDGSIEGVVAEELKVFRDARGFLIETFRIDRLVAGVQPVMSYVSCTEPGLSRGPHEHREQTDLFAFAGPGTFSIWMWDNRADSPTYGTRAILEGGEDRPLVVVIPPGVVHAYRNVTAVRGWVLNYPDRLYAGWGKKEAVDEIRHEDERDVFYEDFVR